MKKTYEKHIRTFFKKLDKKSNKFLISMYKMFLIVVDILFIHGTDAM